MISRKNEHPFGRNSKGVFFDWIGGRAALKVPIGYACGAERRLSSFIICPT